MKFSKNSWRFLLLLSGLLPLTTFAANWTDRKEYDLVLTIRAEATPQRRLDLLDSWKKNYPKTELSEARLELYLQTYGALGDRARMFETARQILANQDNNPVGLYWCTALLPELENPSPDWLEAGEKSARRLLSGLNTFFAPEKKPPAVADAEWQKQKTVVEVLAHRTLGWAHWQRGELPAAEEEFTICLQKDPHNEELSAWLGIVLALENGKQIPALWHLAHGTKAQDGSSLPDGERRQVGAMLQRMYVSYHGSDDGLDELRNAAAANTFPPPEFTVDPATVVAARRAEAELSLTNPELASWLSIRRQLTAPGGDGYFTGSLQSKPLPRLKGTLLHAVPAHSTRELTLSMGDSGSPDVILKLTSGFPKYLPTGSKIAFQATAESFSKDPFQLVVSADISGIEPQSARPAPRH